MNKFIFPPESWSEDLKHIEAYSVFDMIMKSYDDNDILFKVIKNNGKIKDLTKRECTLQSRILANKILTLIKKKREI